MIEYLAPLNAFFSLKERYQKWRGSHKREPVDTLASRFIRVFESHGVHRNQIPRFLGGRLSLADVQDDKSLIMRLDDELLDEVAQRFAIRREWLACADTQIYTPHDFYKTPEDISGFLDRLRVENPEGELDALLLAPDDDEGEALAVLYERIGAIGDRPIFRFHLCNNWSFSYWKSRAYLTAFVATLWKHQVHIRGRYWKKKDIEALEAGNSFISVDSDGFWLPEGKHWYLEDMALEPAVFLRGVDPERQNFGVVSALKKWLDLQTAGHMATGLSKYRYEEVREKFQGALEKLEKF